MNKWMDIEPFHRVRKDIEVYSEFARTQLPLIIYRAKVKLHGTNAGIQIKSTGDIQAQGRKVELDIKSDNRQFAAWVKANEKELQKLIRTVKCVIHGEWFGKGINKGVSCSKIGRKCFAVFAVEVFDNEESDMLLVDPDEITKWLGNINVDGMYVIPWYGEPISFVYGLKNKLKEALEEVNSLVLEVENRDPFISEFFGIDGLGEGIVLYPYVSGFVDRKFIKRYIFKAKGEKNRVCVAREPTQMDPTIVKEINDFVEMVCPEARLEQAYEEACNNDCDIRKIGKFIEWVAKDVLKECKLEIAASGINWKQIAKVLNKKAVNWFKEKL